MNKDQLERALYKIHDKMPEELALIGMIGSLAKEGALDQFPLILEKLPPKQLAGFAALLGYATINGMLADTNLFSLAARALSDQVGSYYYARTPEELIELKIILSLNETSIRKIRRTLVKVFDILASNIPKSAQPKLGV